MAGKLQVSEIQSSANDNNLTVTGSVTLNGSGLNQLILPAGTFNDVSRSTPVEGAIRYDKHRDCLMIYDGSTWRTTENKNDWDLIPQTGLCGHYDAACPLSYPGHGNTWFDISPAKNHLYARTLGTREPKWYESEFGGGWYFGGESAQAWKGIFETRQKNMTSHLFDYTVLSWVKFSRVATHSRYYLIDSRIEDGNRGGGLGIDRETVGGSAFHFTQDGASTYDEPTTPTYDDQKVYQLGLTRSGTSIQVLNNDSRSLINPSLVYDLLSTNYIPMGRFRLGSYSGSGSGTSEYWWAGHCYVIMIYNRSLNQSEINQIYNVYAPRFGFTVV